MRYAAMLILLALVPLGAGAEAPPGRLFSTPAQRARLDTLRDEALANINRPKPAAPKAEAPKTSPARIMTLNGIVRRSDGEVTIWVNGKATGRGAGEGEIARGSVARDSAGIVLPESGRSVRLKVGQTIEATSGVVEESYLRRRTLPVAAPAESAPPNPDTTAPEAVPPGNGSSPVPAPGAAPAGKPDGRS